MVGQSRSREELLKLFIGQMKALEASSKNFDDGEEWEAERLATTVFNLVFDDRKIVSLLTQLGMKDALRFVSSGRLGLMSVFKAGTGLPVVQAMPSLLVAQFDRNLGARFAPKLGDGPPTYRSMSFDDWWKEELIYVDKASGPLNRQRLVFALRHQDGGAHIGSLTDEVYVHLKNGAGWELRHSDGRTEPVENLIAASMRQVAWEVLETMDQIRDNFD